MIIGQVRTPKNYGWLANWYVLYYTECVTSIALDIDYSYVSDSAVWINLLTIFLVRLPVSFSADR